MQYSGGVITDESCFADKEVNHAVLIVGYGQEQGLDYFLVKNSWGEEWGDKGYVKIGMQSGEGVCGIQVAPMQAETKGLNQGASSLPTPQPKLQPQPKAGQPIVKPKLNLASLPEYYLQ